MTYSGTVVLLLLISCLIMLYSKVNFDIFMKALRSLAVSVYENTDGGSNSGTMNVSDHDQDMYLLKLLVSHVLPQKLEDPEVQAVLRGPNTTVVAVGKSKDTVVLLPTVPNDEGKTTTKVTPPRPVDHSSSRSDSNDNHSISHGIIKSITPSAHQSNELSSSHSNNNNDIMISNLVKSILPSPSSSSSSSSFASVTTTSTSTNNKNSKENLQEFLVAVRLESFASAVADLGVDTVQDVTELTEEDLDSIGMKQLHKRRLKDAITKWKQDHHISSSSVPSKHPEIASPSVIAAKEAEVAAILLGPSTTTSHSVQQHEPTLPSHSSSSSFSGVAEKNQVQEEKENKPTENSYSSSNPGQTSKLAFISTVYEWEEYANADGFLYYHSPSTGVTQWLKPFSNSIRTVAQRESEKATLAAMVEERMRQALMTAASANAVRKSVTKTMKSPTIDNKESIPPTDNAQIIVHNGSNQEQGSIRSSPKQAWQEILNDAHLVQGDNSSNSESPKSKQSPHKTFRTIDPTSSYSAAVAALLAEDEAENEQERMKQITGQPRPSIRSVSRSSRHSTSAGISTQGSRSRARSVDERTRGSTANSRSPGKSPLKNAPMRANSTHSKAFVQQSTRSNSVSQNIEEYPGGFNDALIDPNNTSIPDGRSVISTTSSSYLGRRPPPTPSTTLALRNAAANRSIGGESLAETYADVFGDMTHMDDATAEIIARAHTIANPRKMGYADPRPDVRPTSSFGVHEDHRAERVHFTAASSNGGKSFAEFASSLRSHLYSPRVDPNTPRTGRDHMDKWNSPGLAPSNSTTSYAYKHASAVSRWGEKGTVFDRLTDHRGYVGTHKHRFDADGRGTGLSGRDSGVDTQWINDSIPDNAHQGAPYLVPGGVRSGYGYSATSGKIASTRE